MKEKLTANLYEKCYVKFCYKFYNRLFIRMKHSMNFLFRMELDIYDYLERRWYWEGINSVDGGQTVKIRAQLQSGYN